MDDRRLARLVAEASTPRAPRATREDFIRYTLRRFGLTDELAARITGRTMREITQQARELARTRDRIAAAEAEANAERRSATELKPKLLPQGYPPETAEFDPDAVIHRLRQD